MFSSVRKRKVSVYSNISVSAGQGGRLRSKCGEGENADLTYSETNWKKNNEFVNYFGWRAVELAMGVEHWLAF